MAAVGSCDFSATDAGGQTKCDTKARGDEQEQVRERSLTSTLHQRKKASENMQIGERTSLTANRIRGEAGGAFEGRACGEAPNISLCCCEGVVFCGCLSARAASILILHIVNSCTQVKNHKKKGLLAMHASVSAWRTRYYFRQGQADNDICFGKICSYEMRLSQKDWIASVLLLASYPLKRIQRSSAIHDSGMIAAGHDLHFTDPHILNLQ